MEDEACLDQIAGFLNEALEMVADVKVVVENTAGSGGSVGYRFEHLAYLIERIEVGERIGVCLDTCHLYAAGYDIARSGGLAAVFEDFDRIVGFPKLCGMHLNDSAGALGGRLDRHRSLGEGRLGLECFRLLVNDPRLEEIPLILETPVEAKWPAEIKMLYELIR
jgi:deoxyribonuclease-4